MLSIDLRVVYDEDRDRTDDEITREISEEVSELYGVEEVTVTDTNTARPPIGFATVSFDENLVDASEVVYEVSTLDFVHNAMEA